VSYSSDGATVEAAPRRSWRSRSAQRGTARVSVVRRSARAAGRDLGFPYVYRDEAFVFGGVVTLHRFYEGVN
jgi:hypothetical protein